MNFAEKNMATNTASAITKLREATDRSPSRYLIKLRKRVPPQYTYELRDTDITLTTDIKYLGVTVDDKLVWNKRLAIITTTANSTLGFLRRNIMTKLTSIRSQSYM